MRYSIFTFLAFSLFFACGKPAKKHPSPKHDHKHDHHDGHSHDDHNHKTGEHHYKLTPFEGSKDYPDATISDMKYNKGMFKFNVKAKDYQLGQQTSDAPQKMCANSAKGQHIHLIVDDKPYAAKYTAEFEHGVDDGEHYILSFLSRSYHESLKHANSRIAEKVIIKDKTITDRKDIKSPMIFYSRPKGTYIGEDTKKIMLDFYLVNAELGTNYKVKALINNETFILDKWQPYYIEGLPMGENTIELSLIDAKGELVKTPLNPVKRTFELKENMPK